MASVITTLLDALREGILLKQAEARANAMVPEARATATELVSAGSGRYEAALSLGAGHEVSTALLLREAVSLLLLAYSAQRNGPSTSRDDVWAALEDSAEIFDTTSRQAIEAALRAEGGLADDRTPLADLDARNTRLFSAGRALLSRIELRTPKEIRRVRRIRIAVSLSCAILCVVFLALALNKGANLARGRTVSASSIDPQSPSMAQLVDGDAHGAFGAKTSGDASPWLMVDLGTSHAIDRIVVYNRGDGREDDCLPLIAEISLDAQDWHLVDRRTTRFTQDAPWEMRAGGSRARYVRLRVDHFGYLALSEIEVFGR